MTDFNGSLKDAVAAKLRAVHEKDADYEAAMAAYEQQASLTHKHRELLALLLRLAAWWDQCGGTGKRQYFASTSTGLTSYCHLFLQEGRWFIDQTDNAFEGLFDDEPVAVWSENGLQLLHEFTPERVLAGLVDLAAKHDFPLPDLSDIG